MLKAGFARLDVTPPLGSYLSGYFYARYADGILDPIELNAIAIGNGTDTLVIIECDFLGFNEKFCNPVRENIAEKLSIPVDNIMIAALHQHTSISIRDDNPILKDTAYLDLVYRKLVDAAVLAVADMSDATMSYAEEQTAEPIAFIRRYWMKDGTVATNPGRLNPNVVRPCNDADNTVRVLRFKREGANDIALVNFSTHPDVVSGTKLSADWPGFARRFVEADLEGVSCLLVNGVQGDSNHVDVFNDNNKGYEHARKMGRLIADAVRNVWDKTVDRKGEKISGALTTVYTKTRTDGEEKYAEMKAFYDAYEAGTLGYKPHITELTTAKRIITMREEKIYRPVNVTVMGVGDVAFVGFGGEPFTKYAENARAAAPDKQVICLCCANGYNGYLPTVNAFKEGGYEASSSRFSPDLETQVCGAAAELLAKL